MATSLLTTVISFVLGGALAWLEVTSDFRFKKAIRSFSMIAFIIPPYILGLAWVQFFGRNGYLERMLRSFFIFQEYTFPYYSIVAVAIVMALHLYPLMYMSLRNALAQQEKNLEKAALLSGASYWNTVFSITLPLIKPSLFATGLLIFSRTMANFTVPALLALPARKEYLTTLVYSAISGLDIATASAVSLFLVAISTVLFWSQHSMAKKGLQYVSAGQGGGGTSLVSLKGHSIWVSLLFFLIMGVTIILPIVTMFFSSFLKRWGLPLQWQYSTLANYAELLSPKGKAFIAFRNSIVYGVVAASFALIIGGATAYVAHTSKTTRSKVLESIATWPMAFPNIVLAVAAVLAWNHGPLHVYGTPWAIILTYMVLFIPIVMKQVTGLIQNYDTKLLFAARLSGASPLQSFVTITLPILAPGLKSGFIICFLIALQEIPISLMLYFTGQETVGVLLFGMHSKSYGLEMTSALSMVIILLLLIGNIIIRRITRKHTYENTAY
ncbi:MAG: iron ABC transporter permease [Sphaerochaeta sp.]|nr:iron ABC transporter permease [Sphaerochaeta sp.]